MTWRGNLKLRPGRRKKYDAVHDELHAHVEQQRAQAKQYEDELSLVPESHFDGNQVTLFHRMLAEPNKQQRKAERFARTAQTGSFD